MNKPGEEPLLSLPERHSRILSLLQQNGSISVTQLSELFKVSEVTIRKDLSYLEQQKKLYRTHGSAILISPYISDCHVRLLSINETDFLYFKALNLIDSDVYDETIMEPIVFASNVHGGLGIVSISTETSVKINLTDEKYDER